MNNRQEQLTLAGFEVPEPEPTIVDMDEMAARIAEAAQRRMPDDRPTASERWFAEIGGNRPSPSEEDINRRGLAAAREVLNGIIKK